MRAAALQQLFVKRAGGRIEFLMVMESPAGARERRTLITPASDEDSAIEYLARYLARDGSGLHGKLRVRRERGTGLEDAPRLKEALTDALRAQVEA